MTTRASGPEIASFVANALKATRAGKLDWEQAGSGKLLATLDSDYSVTLEKVEDFDSQTDDPDHILTLLQGQKTIFSVDRRYVSGDELGAALDEPVEYSYRVFSELWRRALLRASHVEEHLNRVNRLLEGDLPRSRRGGKS